jgi:hypothetical protein
MSSESLLKSQHTLWNILWNDLRWYCTLQFPITFHLQDNFTFMLSSTGDISVRMIHPVKKSCLFASSTFPRRLPFHPCPNFSSFLLHPFPHISSVLSPPPLPHRSFNIFVFKFFTMTDYSEVLSIAHTYTEQKDNFQTPRPSVRLHQCLSRIHDLYNYPIHCIFVFNSVK